MKKRMQKAILFPLLLLLLASFAAGCAEQTAGTSSDAPSEAETNPITSSEAESTAETTLDENSEQSADKSWTLLEFPDSELKQAVESAWEAKQDESVTWFDESPYIKTVTARYYGTYNEFPVFFFPVLVHVDVAYSKNIAGEVFEYGTNFSIEVYADEELVPLENAYENGLLTKEQIAEIAAYHRGFQKYAREQQRLVDQGADR